MVFPDRYTPEMEEKIKKALEICKLEKFIPRLQEVATWSDQMSPGEQQRVAFVRVFIQRPEWVFLDESTSMLDMPNEALMYDMISKELPACSVVSVGHRPSLDVFHEHIIDVAKYTSH